MTRDDDDDDEDVDLSDLPRQEIPGWTSPFEVRYIGLAPQCRIRQQIGASTTCRASTESCDVARRSPAERPGDETDNYLSYTVEMTALGHAHEITAGIADFELATEQYWVLHDDLIDVLATTTHPVQPYHPWHRPITSPAVWTRQRGAGRIFVATPGHSVDVLEDANVRTIVERGMLWASRANVPS